MNLNNYIKGWLVGDFEPSLFKNKDIEIGVKYYKTGDIDDKHYHKVTKEYTIVIYGKIKMLEKIYGEGDIVEVLPFVENEFQCLENACVLVIKTPSVPNDKYFI